MQLEYKDAEDDAKQVVCIVAALSEAQEELQAQILTRGVEEGRSLLDGVSGPLGATHSLAHELSQMSDDEVTLHTTYLLTTAISWEIIFAKNFRHITRMLTRYAS